MEQIHGIIRDTAKQPEKKRSQGSCEKEDADSAAAADTGELSRDVMSGVRLSASLWGVDNVEWRDAPQTVAVLFRLVSVRPLEVKARHHRPRSQTRQAKLLCG